MPFPNPDNLPLTDTDIGRGVVIPTADPDHGRKVMSILGALSEGALKPLPRVDGDERRARDLADFGAAYVSVVERQFPDYYRGRAVCTSFPIKASDAAGRFGAAASKQEAA